MPPKFKVTKEEIVSAALDILREQGVSAITAQAIARRMGTSTRPMFNHFATVEELRQAAIEQARALYNQYAEAGLEKTPAAKGFALAYIIFAMEEPSLFRTLFMQKSEEMSLRDFLRREGHWNQLIQSAQDTFKIGRADAAWLYENMWIYAHGLATLCASEITRFSTCELAERLGQVCRSLLASFALPYDARTGIIPQKGATIPGQIEDYKHGR